MSRNKYEALSFSDSEEEVREKFAEYVLPPHYVGSLREKIFSFLEHNKASDLLQSTTVRKLSMCCQIFMMVLILTSTATFIAMTHPQFYGAEPLWVKIFDICLHVL